MAEIGQLPGVGRATIYRYLAHRRCPPATRRHNTAFTMNIGDLLIPHHHLPRRHEQQGESLQPMKCFALRAQRFSLKSVVVFTPFVGQRPAGFSCHNTRKYTSCFCPSLLDHITL